MYNLIPKERDPKNNRNITIAIIISLITFSFLIFYINIQDFFFPKQIEKNIPFENCKLLTNSCLNRTCPYYFLCGIVEFTDCKVYDCGDKYGILIKNEENETIIREQSKPDKAKIKEAVEKCKGWISILEKKYENGKLEIKTEVTTEGDCQIQAFMVKTEQGFQTADFEKADDYYNLILAPCPEKVFRVIAVGEGGVSIREK